jgi:copper homeostasis protein
MAQKAQLEIACFNLAAALIAQKNGADRVEFCDGILVGGLTPDFISTELAKASLSIDLLVMIRPRGGNFVYTEDEFSQMKSAITVFKKLGVNGFVFGILNEDNTIDIVKNKELVDLAHPLPCTFHRAFDQVTDAFQSLEDVICCGFYTILTSGQSANVQEGINRLAELVTKANNRIAIMPGGGLRSTNISEIKTITKALFYHSSAITSEGEVPNPFEIQELKAKLL